MYDLSQDKVKKDTFWKFRISGNTSDDNISQMFYLKLSSNTRWVSLFNEHVTFKIRF